MRPVTRSGKALRVCLSWPNAFHRRDSRQWSRASCKAPGSVRAVCNSVSAAGVRSPAQWRLKCNTKPVTPSVRGCAVICAATGNGTPGRGRRTRAFSTGAFPASPGNSMPCCVTALRAKVASARAETFASVSVPVCLSSRARGRRNVALRTGNGVSKGISRSVPSSGRASPASAALSAASFVCPVRYGRAA